MLNFAAMWSRLNIAQAIVLAVFLVALACVIIFAPAALWGRVNWQTVAAVVVALFSAGGSAALGPLLHARPVRGPSVPPDDEGGV